MASNKGVTSAEITDSLQIQEVLQDPRRSTISYSEDDLAKEERIELNALTELIPDEYDNNGSNGAVHIFRSNKRSDAENTFRLLDCLETYGYDIPLKNIYIISSKAEVQMNLKEISEKDYTDKSCLIIIFLGEIEKEDNFIPEIQSMYTISTKDVWSPFINCRSLKHKPKIFLFQASKYEKKVAVDTHMFFIEKQEYDIPAEADILIVYKKLDGYGEAKLKFINELCENFEKYGRRDDIISMVTHTDHSSEKRPLIISTLTRKFFIASSSYRDHFLDIDNQQNRVMETISELQKKIAELEEHDSRRKKVKPASSFRKMVNRIKQIGNNSNSTPEEAMQVDNDSGKQVKRSSTPKSTSNSEATSSATFTDSAPEKKISLKKQNSPRPAIRKSSTSEPSKPWRP